jgi:hypothetical protein
MRMYYDYSREGEEYAWMRGLIWETAFYLYPTTPRLRAHPSPEGNGVVGYNYSVHLNSPLGRGGSGDSR